MHLLKMVEIIKYEISREMNYNLDKVNWSQFLGYFHGPLISRIKKILSQILRLIRKHRRCESQCLENHRASQPVVLEKPRA